ncbi:TRAP transporter small permease [Arenibaculum pallidiluteum]|uniref:TRAP transporter small permease n=1 Tax=Arenibaculum pallidiluteum TaxID=2812559 RepID=UPI002E2BEA69|nr:TRAP transporter small permease [Arenibaculum pallidiluteum]
MTASAAGAAGTPPRRDAPRRSSLVKAFLAFERTVNLIVTTAACLCLAVAVAAGFYQVVTRFVLQQPSVWSEALTRTLLIWMVYLGIMAAFRQGSMISVDLAQRRARGWFATLLGLFIPAASLTLLGIIGWFGYQMMLRVQSQNLAGLEVSIAWAYAALPVGASVTVLAVLAHWLDPEHRELETAQ